MLGGTLSRSISVKPPPVAAAGIGCFGVDTGRPGVGAVGRGVGPVCATGFRLLAP
jgi:hypothetical protein